MKHIFFPKKGFTWFFLLVSIVFGCQKDEKLGVEILQSPTIEGEALLGGTIKANIFDDAPDQSWKRVVSWYYDGDPIPKKIGGDLAYELSGNDIGHKIRVGLKYVKGVAEVDEVFSEYSEKVYFMPNPPILKGEYVANTDVKVELNEINVEGWTPVVKWYIGGTPLPLEDSTSEKNLTHNLSFDDIGKTIKVGVRYKKMALETAEIFSKTAGPISFVPDVPVLPSVIQEQSQVVGNFQNTPDGWYRHIAWYRDSEVIHGQHDDVYIFRAEDLGKKIFSSVIFSKHAKLPTVFVNRNNTNTQYESLKTPSLNFELLKPVSLGDTRQVFSAPVVPTMFMPRTPKLAGRLGIGDTIRVENLDSPEGWTRTLKWYEVTKTTPVEVKLISSNTNKLEYTIKDVDLYKRFRVGVSFSKDSKTTKEVYSEDVDVIAFDPQCPKILGEPKFASVLTLKADPAPEDWSTYVVWYRDGG